MPPSTTPLTLLACAGLIGTAATKSNGTTISCNDIPPPNIPGADIVAFSAQKMFNVSGPTVDEPSAPTGYIEGLNICNVVTVLSHAGVGDRVEFHVWLPLDGWNGRFMATGGAAYLGGLPGTQGLGTPVKDGFAAGMTDGGSISEGGEYLNPDMIQSTGAFDLGRFADFSS